MEVNAAFTPSRCGAQKNQAISAISPAPVTVTTTWATLMRSPPVA